MLYGRFICRKVSVLFFFFLVLASFANDSEKVTNSSREKPWIVFEHYEEIDSPGAENGLIVPSGSIEVPVQVRNAKVDTAHRLTDTSLTADPYATITKEETSSPMEMSWIVFEYCEIIDSTGDDDGLIDPGENIELPIAIRNRGVDAANSLTGTLRTTDTYVTITDSIEEFGDVPPGSVSLCLDAFRFSVDSACPSSHAINFELVTIDFEERISTNVFSIFVLSGDIFISEDTLDFETAFIGYSDTLEFQVINIGSSTLEVNDIWSDNYDYSVDVTSFSLLPGGSRTVQVMFTPITEGISTGSLTVRSDGSDTSVVFLQGEGLVPPDISISPDSLIDSLFAGETSTCSLLVSNMGESDLTFYLSLEGADSIYALGNALKFDGYNDYVEVPDVPSLSAIGGAFTLEFWMKVEESSFQTREILGKWGKGMESDDEYCLNVRNTGKLELDISGSAGGFSRIWSNPILPYTWVHVAEVFDSASTSYKLFINGILESDTTPSTLTMNRNTNQPFRMGTYDNYYFSNFKGQLDEIRIWNVARTQTEIQANMYRDLSGTLPGLLGYWKFNENSGNTAYDSSPNNNDGTLHSLPAWVVSSLPATWLSFRSFSDTVKPDSLEYVEVTLYTRGLNDGDYDAYIIISSNDPDDPEIRIPVRLHVTGIPNIAVLDSTIDYDTVFDGYSSTDTLIVNNDGTDLLTISDISSDNADFIVDITNFSIVPGESEEVVVTFTPSATGIITGTLTITSDDPDESPFEVYLEGDCIGPPDISISPDSLSDSLLSGDTSIDTLTIYNTGLSDLLFNVSFDVSSGVSVEEVFGSWDGSKGLGSSRDRGNVFYIDSATTLKEIKFYMDFLSSTQMYFFVYEGDNLQGNYIKVGETYISSSGTGEKWYSSGPMEVKLAAGKYYYIGTSWDYYAWFGRGNESIPISTSFGSLRTGISTKLAGFPPSESIYQSQSASTSPFYQTIITTKGFLHIVPPVDTIPPNDSLYVEVTFNSTDFYGGDYFEDVIFASNDPDEPEVIIPAHLHVTGMSDIAVSDDTLDLGGLFVGASFADTLIIANEGTESLFVSSISSDNSDYSVDITSFSLGPESNQEILITFTPSTTGVITGTLTIESDDPDESVVTVFLQGEGLAAPVMKVEPDYLSDTLTTGESASHILTIGNAGGNNLTFEIMYESLGGLPLVVLDENQVKLGVKNKTESTNLLNQSFENQSNKKEFQSDKPEGSSPISAGAYYEGDFLRFYISDYGEFVSLQYPGDMEHLYVANYLSGYTVCYNDGTDKIEWAGYGSRFGIEPVSKNELVNNEDYAAIDFVTQTSGGELTITQRFIFDKHDKFVRTEVRIENTSGDTLDDIVFKIWADWDMDYDYHDDNWDYDLTHNMIYAWDEHYGTIAGQVPPDYRDIEGWDDYNRRVTDEDYIDGPLMDFDGLEILHYELDSLPVGEGRILNFAYGAADNLKELKLVIERGIAGTERFTANPDTGTVPISDSLEIEVVFNSASLYAGDYYGKLLISSNDPITPFDTVLCFMHVTGTPFISTSTDTLEFSADSTDTLELQVLNMGTDTLVVSNISSDNSDFVVDITNFILTPYGSQKLEVIFTRASGDDSKGNLTIQSNDPGKGTYTVTLIGNAPSGIEENIPQVFSISANYPNPFCKGTVIKYGCPERTKVSIQVFDIMGRLVKTIVDKEVEAGYHEVRWDGSVNSGRKVSSGVYFYIMKANDFEASRKMIFAK